jgi:two-component system phosphate regulon sensor histidine kinase PhoR
MAEGVLALDEEDRIISMNRAAAEMFDVEPEDALGKSLPEAIRNINLLEFVPRAASGEKALEDDILVLREGERHLQASGVALKDGAGRRMGALIVLNDITRLSRLERVRKEFVANVSHELKTPVTAVKGAAETLMEGGMESVEDRDRFLALLLRQADRMNAIIEDLLLLARIEQEEGHEAIELADGPVRAVLRAALNACSRRAEEKGISLELSCPEGLRAKINPMLLEQAVVNLIDNAVKYSEPGRAVAVRGVEDAGQVLIEVEDQGVGIEKKHHERLFERFYRVDKARSRKMGGTGLGLAIVKHIARAHGGSVEVRSTPGEGSVFRILLRASRGREQGADQS